MVVQLDATLESKPHPVLFIARPSFVDPAIPIHPPSSILYPLSSILHPPSSTTTTSIYLESHVENQAGQMKHPPSSILHAYSYYYSMEDKMMMEDGGWW
jgi:hypothetical protein